MFMHRKICLTMVTGACYGRGDAGESLCRARMRHCSSCKDVVLNAHAFTRMWRYNFKGLCISHHRSIMSQAAARSTSLERGMLVEARRRLGMSIGS